MKTPRGRKSYQRSFSDVIDGARLSSEAYDKGFYGEAKRLAVCVRVLVHDTRQSTSLFEQLGIKRKLSFLGSPNPYGKNNLLAECHLVMAFIGAQPTYVPLLDTDPMGMGWQRLPFDSWWNEPVIRDAQRQLFSRKDIVLWFANKEGGAHVDPLLDERYRRLQEDNSYGEVFMTGDAVVLPAAAIELACMRQIAHEILRTIERNAKGMERSLK